MPWLPIGGWFSGLRVIFSLKSGVTGLKSGLPEPHLVPQDSCVKTNSSISMCSLKLDWKWKVVVAKLITSQNSRYTISGSAEFEWGKLNPCPIHEK